MAGSKITSRKSVKKSGNQQMVCPHTIRALQNVSQLPIEADQQRCPVCWADWFSTNDTGGLVIPVVVRHCGHVMCSGCILTQRTESLECTVPWCKGVNGVAPLNVPGCTDCYDWDNHYLQPTTEKEVLTVSQGILGEWLLDGLKELEQEHKSFFKVQPAKKNLWIKYWKTALYNFEGQYHRWDDLAEILDPFRGADVIHSEVVEQYGEELLEPMPTEPDRGMLKTHPNLASEYPNGVEPWISTFIRTMMYKLSKEPGETKTVQYRTHGEKLLRHERKLEAHHNEDGEWLDDWPVKKILGHRIDEDGDIEYHVQYVGFTLPSDCDWRYPEEVRLGSIVRKYNVEHSIVLPMQAGDGSAGGSKHEHEAENGLKTKSGNKLKGTIKGTKKKADPKPSPELKMKFAPAKPASKPTAVTETKRKTAAEVNTERDSKRAKYSTQAISETAVKTASKTTIKSNGIINKIAGKKARSKYGNYRSGSPMSTTESKAASRKRFGKYGDYRFDSVPSTTSSEITGQTTCGQYGNYRLGSRMSTTKSKVASRKTFGKYGNYRS